MLEKTYVPVANQSYKALKYIIADRQSNDNTGIIKQINVSPAVKAYALLRGKLTVLTDVIKIDQI
jgi:hypothetical protein